MALYAETSDKTYQYSMPAHVGRAAMRLGLNVTVHMDGCIIPALLQSLYPQATQQCFDLGINVEYSAPGPLAQNQRQLCVVGLGMGVFGMHYVMYRPDGTYMDPANSREEHTSLLTMGQGYGNIVKYWIRGSPLCWRIRQRFSRSPPSFGRRF